MSTSEAQPIGGAIRRQRLRENLTQQDLASAADLSQRTISLIENGRQAPRQKTLQRLAEVLEVYPDDLDPGFAAAREPHSAARMPDEVAKPLLRLVGSLARKYARWPGERSELRSAGQDGLWEAWRKFDPERNVPFEMFAAKLIKWRVLDKRRALLRDATTANYGFGSLPRWVREVVGDGGSDEESDDRGGDTTVIL